MRPAAFFCCLFALLFCFFQSVFFAPSFWSAFLACLLGQYLFACLFGQSFRSAFFATLGGLHFCPAFLFLPFCLAFLFLSFCPPFLMNLSWTKFSWASFWLLSLKPRPCPKLRRQERRRPGPPQGQVHLPDGNVRAHPTLTPLQHPEYPINP